jgi:hypothetical protein
MKQCIFIDAEQMQVIKDALNKAPYDHAAAVIAHINSEITRLYNEQYDKQREPKTVDHHPV